VCVCVRVCVAVSAHAGPLALASRSKECPSPLSSLSSLRFLSCRLVVMMPQRRKKTSAQRREQRLRSQGRHIGFIIKAVGSLNHHSGSQPTTLAAALIPVLSPNSEPEDVPPPTFRTEDVQPQCPPQGLQLFSIEPLLVSVAADLLGELSHVNTAEWEPLPSPVSPISVTTIGNSDQPDFAVENFAMSLFKTINSEAPLGISIALVPDFYEKHLGVRWPCILPGNISLVMLLRNHPSLFELIELDSHVHVSPKIQ